MENAADALKMAAAILIFILAIASSFSLFGTAKQTADSIVTIRDKQAYLEAAELEGVLYTSSDTVKTDTARFTENGDRIVNFSDIISTIYRYNKEKYGVTITYKNGEVIVRYDSNTEDVMRQYYNIKSGLEEYKKKLEENTANTYAKPKFSDNELEKLYKITVIGGSGNITCGAPWYGNDAEIQKRIIKDVNGTTYKYNGQEYEGKKLLEKLNGKRIVEVTNEIDQSKYLKDGEEDTNLLQQYNMPTVEIVYIILD